MQLDAEVDQGWQPLPFEGSWFPDAFIPASTTCTRTMAVVEAAYSSSGAGGIAPAYEPNRRAE